MGLTNAMEGLYLTSTDINNVIRYYELATQKVKLDINKLLNKSNESLTSKELDRLKLYSFRYKMVIQHVSDNTDSRLDKPHRRSLTTPNKDIV